MVALALARFAVNGLYGEWRGTVFSSAGGPWSRVGLVALRYLALSCVWLLPMVIIGGGEGAAPGGMSPMMMGTMLSGMLGLGAIFVLAATLTPPLFLIVSVSAGSFPEIFSPQTWKRLFGGRLGDLFTVYTVYTGALVMVLLLGMPAAMLAFAANTKLGVLVSALGLALVLGVAVNLLGRLCGFFACGDLGLSQPSAPEPTGPRPEVNPLPDPAPEASLAAPAGVAKTALMDAKPRVDAALAAFADDPSAAIVTLEQLDNDYAPHALVRHAMTICLHRSGEAERALRLARSAVPLCLERGHTILAAQLLKELRLPADQLEVDKTQMIALANSLASSEDWAAAARLYSAVLRADTNETRAVKGLLKVASGILDRKSNPVAAAKIYRFLDKHCADSPLAEYVREGLAETERRLEAETATKSASVWNG